MHAMELSSMVIEPASQTAQLAASEVLLNVPRG
eukprot:CAMPEP_0119523862 /NCGR_PEP_ID=MMETSP1344-20130328/38868_1 /TAXON_ID=236787 /ORGANISM="Florenciella parvula, Strain CCMP2471" /LENGTH=32 /DNA_ID= /DNA_START= /DNA_END= /DNA_ORIENTATION=